ncbi:MAG: trigger factor [Parcubacteria group bacterium Gr01-1014_56]|nr:MAG: trigger factor [Parcubacteria group bacterium Gr01-1014_56]
MQNANLNNLATSFAKKSLPGSEIELSGEIPAETIAPYRETALKHLSEHIEMPGFRPGKVPPHMIVNKIGEVAVLEEAVELFMRDFYVTLLETHKIDAVGRPDIRIMKLAPGNPVSIVVNTTVYPEVTLPKNWKSLGNEAALEPASLATDEEVEQTIESLRKSRAQKGKENEEPVLPELTDEFAKTIGKFETVEELKAQIKKGIGEEKERAAKDKRRGKIIEVLIEKMQIEVPKIFVDSELEKIIAQLKEDIARFNIPYDDYLKRVGKTEELLKEEFREQARKRALLQLALNKIAEEEKVEADKDMVESEIKHALEHFPDAKPDLLRIHVETVLRNEKVLQMLEGGEVKK